MGTNSGTLGSVILHTVMSFIACLCMNVNRRANWGYMSLIRGPKAIGSLYILAPYCMGSSNLCFNLRSPIHGHSWNISEEMLGLFCFTCYSTLAEEQSVLQILIKNRICSLLYSLVIVSIGVLIVHVNRYLYRLLACCSAVGFNNPTTGSANFAKR